MASYTTASRLSSIIIPCWNEVAFTRRCVAAVMRHTRRPFEMVVVDNGSTDGTHLYVGGVADAASVPVTVIGNATNRGFPAAVNQGIAAARGEFLVLLNNDAVVTDGWLDQLIGLAESDPAIGMAGPMSNYASPPQLVEDVPYANLDEMHGFAARWREEHRGQWLVAGKLSGFCMLMKRAVYRAIGGLDERFGLGFFDDDDLAERARRAGFTMAVARDLFVHHYGSRTFTGQGVDATALLEANAKVYAAKWGEVHGRAVALSPWGGPQKEDGNGGPRRGEETGGKGTEGGRIEPRINTDEHGWDEGRGRDGGTMGRDRVGLEGIPARALGREQAGEVSDLSNPNSESHLCSSVSIGGSNSSSAIEPRMSTDAHGSDEDTGEGSRVGLEGIPAPAPDRERAGEISGSPNPNSESHPCSSVSICGSSSSSSIRGVTRQAKVSLTMIVRDEEDNLPSCLGSVAGLFDEIVLVDTGSRDRTVEIAKSFGARVFDFVWVDDFAAARNAALARARGDFAFWLDADDVVEPEEREKLERLLASLPAEESAQAAYVVRCACDPEPDGRGGNTVVDHIRLFPVREGVRWTYAVHEQILPSLRRAGVPVRWSDVTVRHTGYTDPALRGRKLERDARILEAELTSRPGDPFVLFNLGSIAVERQDWPRALELLQRSLSGSAPTDSITRKLFALIARCQQMLGNLPRAIAACDEGLKFFPDDAELLFRKAVAHRGSGEPGLAEASWSRILGLRRPEQFASVDQGIYGHLTRRNLAALAEERGDLAAALEHWRAVLAECPGDGEAALAVRRTGRTSVPTA